jgi:hypothetical protein
MPDTALNDMRRYVGAMAASLDGTLISASAPRGGHVVHFGAESGRYVGRTAIADSSGVTGYAEGTVIASSGAGLLLEAGADGYDREVARQRGVSFDNHLRIVRG